MQISSSSHGATLCEIIRASVQKGGACDEPTCMRINDISTYRKSEDESLSLRVSHRRLALLLDNVLF